MSGTTAATAVIATRVLTVSSKTAATAVTAIRANTLFWTTTVTATGPKTATPGRTEAAAAAAISTT